MRPVSSYYLVEGLMAVVAFLGWRPVSGRVDPNLVTLTLRRQPLRDRSREHDLSGPEDHG